MPQHTAMMATSLLLPCLFIAPFSHTHIVPVCDVFKGFKLFRGQQPVSLPASHPPHHTPQAACPTAVEGQGRSRDAFTPSHPSRDGRVCDLHFHKAEAVLGWAWRVAPPSLRNAGVERSGGCKGTMLLHLCPAAPTPEAFVLPLKAIIFISRAQSEDSSPDIWKAVQNFALTARSECCSECKHPLFLEPSIWGVSFTLSSCCT